jgi:hypothetical protein
MYVLAQTEGEGRLRGRERERLIHTCAPAHAGEGSDREVLVLAVPAQEII